MGRWLVKQEPTSYSFADLSRDGRTRWDGVHNAQALLHIRAMRPGDEALFYHSGDERACVGILRVDSGPRPDPNDTRGSWFVEVVPVRALRRPVSLPEIRADPAFRGFTLLKISRLSVMPVPDAMWERLLRLSERPAPATATGRPKGRARAVARPPRRGAARRRR
jgi:predicted RNA-binding protein with PUA-like domain